MMNRANTVITAWIAPENVFYFPSWAEFAIGFMILALGMLGFTLAVKLLPVFPPLEEAKLEVTVSAARKTVEPPAT
ncbi:MAG: hypothetical protein QW299_08490 [Candidatus Caldarchaeum sp.]